MAVLGVNVYRWVMLSTHYRNPLNYTEELVTNVKKEVDKVQQIVKQYGLMMQLENLELVNHYDETLEEMVEALEDDLNTSLALSKILEQVKKLNQLYRQKEKNYASMVQSYSTLLKMLDVFGFDFKAVELSEKDKEIYQQWVDYKANRDFEKADQLRGYLVERGIL